MVLGFCMQVIKVIVDFFYSVIGASRLRIGNCDRLWKDGSEIYLLRVTISDYSLVKFMCN